MSATPSDSRLLAPAQVAELLGISVDEVVDLVRTARIRGVRIGSAAQMRIFARSVNEYLDDLAEEERLAALWRQSNEASFPELWGTGVVRNAD
ncbi:helix-turn-helix domain-containing protein [Microbacterium sp.]|jgi:excisionase family DNA binding protein|uniref:helix-turn-helix domain-containing protein n=1 Tax=Microbacterium sp. TaxID=51671 RepID=UPI002C636052|nr:helix-turn-helix domain-containing protein [Microbacterium sp.]HWL77263.1 helix-turn-helix domain-containing protein [Microbacterium sp.]